MYHWRDNLFFGRKMDGSVRIVRVPQAFAAGEWPNINELHVQPTDIDLTIPANEWSSIIASVSQYDQSDSSKAYELAKQLHGQTSF